MWLSNQAHSFPFLSRVSQSMFTSSGSAGSLFETGDRNCFSIFQCRSSRMCNRENYATQCPPFINPAFFATTKYFHSSKASR